jgi:hypothetical protein
VREGVGVAYSAGHSSSTNFMKKKKILIFVGKAQKRDFRKSKPQKNCPNSILVPMAWKWCHSTPFDYLSLIPVFDKCKKIPVMREKPRDEGGQVTTREPHG